MSHAIKRDIFWKNREGRGWNGKGRGKKIGGGGGHWVTGSEKGFGNIPGNIFVCFSDWDICLLLLLIYCKMMTDEGR